MAIEYRIIFPDAAPDLIRVLQNTARVNQFELTEDKDRIGYWLASSKETFFYITAGQVVAHSEIESLEFSFGQYFYQASWYIRCGIDSYGGLLILLTLIKELTIDYKKDFLCLVNGERIVIKEEHGTVYLNQQFGAWDREEVQNILLPISYKLANYPVV